MGYPDGYCVGTGQAVASLIAASAADHPLMNERVQDFEYWMASKIRSPNPSMETHQVCRADLRIRSHVTACSRCFSSSGTACFTFAG